MSEFERTKVDEVVEETHDRYAEWDRQQFIISLDVGEKIEIKVYDEENKEIDSKEYIAKYINCHINCQWQDKGVKEMIL